MTVLLIILVHIYSGLLMYLNGKTFYGFERYPYISSETLCFIIYSYNSRVSKFSEALFNIFERLSEEDIKYFPKEACTFYNISIVEGGASDVIEAESVPLPTPLVEKAYRRIRLPKEYREVIKDF